MARHTQDAANRGRRTAIIAIAAACTAAVVATMLALNHNDGSSSAASPSSGDVAEPGTGSEGPTPSPSENPDEDPSPVAPGDLVLQAAGDAVPLYASAGAAEPESALEQWTVYGSPTTLLGFASTVIDDDSWVEVELPGAPNHRRAWVRAEDVEITSTSLTIDVYLDERELVMSRGGEPVLESPVVIGSSETPTPLGTFWVTDPLDFSANPSGVYGAYALGLNGWSEVLEEFNGGPPQIAIHGTNQPELMGQAVSNGCIRLPNEAALELGGVAGVGTPVTVHESRNA